MTIFRGPYAVRRIFSAPPAVTSKFHRKPEAAADLIYQVLQNKAEAVVAVLKCLIFPSHQTFTRRSRQQLSQLGHRWPAVEQSSVAGKGY
jgi:hypothetical protein